MNYLDRLTARFRERTKLAASDFNRAGRRGIGFRGRLYARTVHHTLPRYIRRHYSDTAPVTRRQRKAVARIRRIVGAM